MRNFSGGLARSRDADLYVPRCRIDRSTRTARADSNVAALTILTLLELPTPLRRASFPPIRFSTETRETGVTGGRRSARVFIPCHVLSYDDRARASTAVDKLTQPVGRYEERSERAEASLGKRRPSRSLALPRSGQRERDERKE